MINTKYVLVAVGVLFCILVFVNYSTLSNKTFRTAQDKHPNLSIKNGALISPLGNPIILRGITSEVFRWELDNRQVALNNTLLRLESVKSWGINALQLYINPRLFTSSSQRNSGMMEMLRTVVNWAERNNIYIILIPVNEIVWEYDLPVRTDKGLATRDSIPQFLELLSSKFASGNVLFGLETEPKFIDTENQLQDRIDAIRKFSNNPIIISTDKFDGILDIASSTIGLKDKNIMLDFHPYLAKDIADYKNQQVEIDKIQKLRNRAEFNTYPFMIGEYGGFWRDDFNTPDDLQILTGIGCWADRNSYSQFIYSLDNDRFPLFDDLGALTPRGKIAKELIGKGRAEFCRRNVLPNLRFVHE